MAASIWEKGEAVYSKLTDNHQVDFWYTKRERDADWFSLIGVVANGVFPTVNPEEKLDYPPHEVFLIGDKVSFTPVSLTTRFRAAWMEQAMLWR
ncbi:hypothetical protein HFN69_22075 [Rhizobium laguerreae]|uniref:hypothetical protein n=1 Tax=Rhizobium laguerreae TaxID=1076926 RepID=UPI001C9269A8|nr:hypothetical protein [Rhizobium laguerreae]MBY3544808.1 hypothetical protein [Rhizobium laguerreae]MBY3549265.1 hypothetical protein [Rhizobium laguerreae]